MLIPVKLDYKDAYYEGNAAGNAGKLVCVRGKRDPIHEYNHGYFLQVAASCSSNFSNKLKELN